MSKRSGIIEKKADHWIPNPKGPRLLPLKKAAENIGLTVWGLREAVWAGLIPVIRLGPKGRKMFIDVKDIEIFIQQNKEVIQ